MAETLGAGLNEIAFEKKLTVENVTHTSYPQDTHRVIYTFIRVSGN